MDTEYRRTPQDLALEYASAVRTIEERKRRCPATAEGLAYAARMDEIAAGLGVCVSEPGVLVSTPEELAIAEQALIDARAALAQTLVEFLALDTARQRTGVATPQTVPVVTAARQPIARSTE
jgi:hypothetical protein